MLKYKPLHCILGHCIVLHCALHWVNVRIAHLSIAHWGAILRWAILSLSVIRIAHPNYDTIFHPACFIKGGGYRFWVVLYVFVRFCQETAHNVAQRQNH